MTRRVLGIETSTTHGSVALLEAEDIVVVVSHDEENRHAELILGLVERALSEAGWAKGSLDRIAAGTGPGMFTGIRVGLSVATGLSIGLGIPAVGVGSLASLALGAPAGDRRLRVAVRDARRGEHFVAAYDADGREVRAPETAPSATLEASIIDWAGSRDFIVVGEPPESFIERGQGLRVAASAAATARLGARLDVLGAPLRPEYVRGPGADRIVLPPSPLDLPRS